MKKNDNIKILTFGLILILAVVTLSFLKIYLQGRSLNQNKDANKLSSQNQSQNIKEGQKITAAEMIKKITKGEQIFIVDIRDPGSFYSEHIMDSVNIPQEEISAKIETLDKIKNYVFVDDFGLTSPTLISDFSKAGFQKAAYLEGGFFEWKNEFNPTVSDGDPNSFTDQSKVQYIKSDDLKKLIESEKNLFIIDVRKSSSFTDGHIKNAVNIFMDDLEKRKREIPIGKKIILYDNDGLWSFKGAVRLFDLGISNVWALSDGLTSWKQKGYEVVK